MPRSSSLSSCNWVVFCDKAGSVITLLAMVPQGGFGMLLLDHYWFSGWTPVVRGIADIVIFVSAEEGKRRLIRFFNREDFKRLPDTFHEFFQRDNWTAEKVAKGILIGIPTVIISGTFSGLAKISWDGVTKLLKNYGFSSFNWVAKNVTSNLWFQRPFMVSAFAANLLCFPNIYKGAYFAVTNVYGRLTESKVSRTQRERFETSIEAVRLYFKHLYESDKNSYKRKLGEFLNSISGGIGRGTFAENVEEATIEEITEEKVSSTLVPACSDAVVRYAASTSEIDISDVPVASKAEEVLKQLCILAALGTVGVGLYNFKNLSVASAQANREAFGLPESSLPRWILEMGTYGSMLAMTLAVMYNNTKGWVEGAFGRRKAIWVLSASRLAFIYITTITICGLGGGPNAYQAYLDHEDLAMLIFAALASFGLESGGYFALTKSIDIENLLRDSDKRIANLVDEKLAAIRDGGPLTRADDDRLAKADDPLLRRSFSINSGNGFEEERGIPSLSPHPSARAATTCCARMGRWLSSCCASLFGSSSPSELTGDGRRTDYVGMRRTSYAEMGKAGDSNKVWGRGYGAMGDASGLGFYGSCPTKF